MNTPTKATVIIPAYNAKATIKSAINSALSQDQITTRVIVLDDQSHDDTYNAAASIKNQSIDLVKNPKNIGPSASRNIGIEHASHDWIVILDADDWMEPERLHTLISLAENHHLDVIADDQALYSGTPPTKIGLRSDKLPILRGAEELTTIDMETLVKNTGLGIVQPVIRRQFLVDNNIRYSTRHRHGEDYLFLFDMLRHGARMGIINKPLYNATLHSQSLTADRVRMFTGMATVLDEIRASLVQMGRNDLLPDIDKAIASTIDTAKYGSVMDPLKRGDLPAAIKGLLRNPSFPLQLARRLVRKIIKA